MTLLIQTPVRKCIPSPKVESDKATYLPDFVFMKKYTIESINQNKPKNCRLTALFFDGYRGQNHRVVVCLCDCGNKVDLRIDHLVGGRSLSCGCLMIERTKKANTKYFPVIEDIYNSWNAMMRRCYNPECDNYKYYGDRGVTVCEEWHNYQNFLNWSLINGWRNGFEIDKDIIGTGFLYSPSTCLWVTSDVNKRHKKNKSKIK